MQDFSAAHGSPMEGYAEDILGGGARYIQWSTSQHLDILVLCVFSRAGVRCLVTKI